MIDGLIIAKALDEAGAGTPGEMIAVLFEVAGVFHPDDPCDDIIDARTGENLFTKTGAVFAQAIVDQASEAGFDLYRMALVRLGGDAASVDRDARHVHRFETHSHEEGRTGKVTRLWRCDGCGRLEVSQYDGVYTEARADFEPFEAFGATITDPFLDETGRFPVDPFDRYKFNLIQHVEAILEGRT